jgi:hypothetical protein
MKKLLLLIVLTITASCSPDEALIKNDTQDKIISDNPIKSGITKRPVPIGDPNLSPTWDWTASSWNVYFKNESGTIGTANTLNPFIDGTQKIYGNTNVSQADMYPSQGWMLVTRDFGTPTDANSYPFILLYNKLRGVLRVCIFRTYNSTTSYQRISLSFANSTNYPNLFNFASNPVNNNANNSYVQNAITYSGVQQWMVAEFNVIGYQPIIDDNSSINITLSEVADSSITLSGTIKLDGTIEPQAQGSKFWDGVDNIANFVASTGPSIVLMTRKNVPFNVKFDAPTTILRALAKSANGFIAGGKTGSTYNIKLSGTINQTGSITLASPKTSFSVYLKPQNTVAYHTLQKIDWGVINFTPTNVIKTKKNIIDSRCPRSTTTVTFPVNFLKNSLKINPTILSSVSDVKVGEITETSTIDDLVSISQYDSVIHTYSWSDKCGVTTFKQVYIGVLITYIDGTVVYQQIPIL